MNYLSNVLEQLKFCECGKELLLDRILVTPNGDIIIFSRCGNKKCTMHKEEVGIKYTIHINECDLKDPQI